jgi:hypothetical protein
MVSGFEKRMLSGMFGLLSDDCAKADDVAPPTANVTAPATTRLREGSFEICHECSEEGASGILSLLRSGTGSIAGEPPKATAGRGAIAS